VRGTQEVRDDLASRAADDAHIVPQRPAADAVTAERSKHQSEIRARVEKFRAHQAKFNREREACCSAAVAKMQATLDKHPVPRSSK